MTGRRRARQKGQVMILAVMVMAFLFVPLAVYVIDTGIVEMSYVELGETLQGAAEDGASSIDVTAYRQHGVIQLDATQARQVVDRSLRVSQLSGLRDWTVDVHGNTVTVSAQVRVGLLAVGSTTLTEVRSASFAHGT